MLCIQTILWDYNVHNNGNIIWDTTTLTLIDSIDNYDYLIFELQSYSNDNDVTNFYEFSVNSIKNSFNPNYFALTTYSQRSTRFYASGTTFYRTTNNDNQGSINGIIRIYGVKYTKAKEIVVFENGAFTSALVPGAGLNNTVGPYKWQAESDYYNYVNQYYGTNKIIYTGYNCTTDYNFIIDSEGNLTQNYNSGYGPNNMVMIPVKRLIGCSKMKYIAKGTIGWRIYPAANYMTGNSSLPMANTGGGTMVPLTTTDYAEYTVNLDSTLPIDRFQFLIENGNVLLKKIWFE